MTQDGESRAKSNYQIAPNHEIDDEIRIIDLWQVLMRRKYIVIGAIIVALSVAIVYLVLTPRVYEGQTRLLLPKQSDLNLVNYEHPLTTFEPKKVFDGFSQVILQISTWRQFTEQSPDLFPPTTNFSRLGHRHPLNTSQKKDVDFEHLILSYEANDAVQAASVLSSYLRFAERIYVEEVIEETRARINQRVKTLEKSIEILQETAKLNREDAIVRLEENLFLAEKAGIYDNFIVQKQKSGAGNDTTVLMADGKFKEYMRGVRELKAELDALKNRSSNTPFINDLREKQIKLDELKKLKLDAEQFHPYRSDGDILPPLYPVSPKITLTLVLALIVGLILGIFAAFFIESINKTRLADNKIAK